MNQLTTTGIILARIDYHEADRILTVLTPERKLHLIAKGARRLKSKLAGGIELFSVSSLSYIRGRGTIGTLVSARLFKHYGHIVQDIGRVQLGYDLIRLLNKVTQDETGLDYFELLNQLFQSLDDLDCNLELVNVWFLARLIGLAGHTPNLRTDRDGRRLEVEGLYQFDPEAMGFVRREEGLFASGHIKFLRLMFGGSKPKLLQQVAGYTGLLGAIKPIIQTMLDTFVRV